MAVSSNLIPSKWLFILFYIFSIFIVSINSGDKCTHLYTNHTISTNIDDPFVYYLGDKTTTAECQDSCVSLNYLCDKSEDDVFHYTPSGETSDWQFNNPDCSVTSTHSYGYNGAFALLTSDITANEYIIEAEITVRSGVHGGIMLKAQQQSPLQYDYWILLCGDNLDIGYHSSSWRKEIQRPSITLRYNGKYTLRIHVIGNTFTTYLDGVQKGNQVVIDDTKWTGNYAGLYIYDSQTVYHSFKVIYPDASDNEGEPVCAAYVYNKDNGACYGYYGRNTVQLKSSKSSDAGIVYDSPTCPPIPTTTTEPTVFLLTSNPSPPPNPSKHPSPSPISTPHPTRSPLTAVPTPIPSADPSTSPISSAQPVPTAFTISSSLETRSDTPVPTKQYPTNIQISYNVLEVIESTTVEIDDENDVMNHLKSRNEDIHITYTVILITAIIVVLLVTLFICVIGVYLYLKRRSLSRKQTEEIIVIAIKANKANVNKDNNARNIEIDDKLENDHNEQGLVEMEYRRTVEGERSRAQSLCEADDMDECQSNPNIADDEFIVADPTELI